MKDLRYVPAVAWECPCGKEPPYIRATTLPVRTLVSLHEPVCPFCGRRYEDEYRIPRYGRP
jgi:hypothetical protein